MAVSFHPLQPAAQFGNRGGRAGRGHPQSLLGKLSVLHLFSSREESTALRKSSVCTCRDRRGCFRRRKRRTPSKDSTAIEYDALGDGVTFSTEPLDKPIEITGPVTAKLFISSSTTDADLFLVLRVFASDGNEVVFQGAHDPHTPIGQGWLRASHRKLDPKRSLPYRLYHTHDEIWPLTPNVPVELDIEIWPTCIVVPAGYRLVLTIRGKDYEYGGAPVVAPHVPYPLRGVGPFIHGDTRDRPAAIFGGKNTLHITKERQPWLLLPIIPRLSGLSSSRRQTSMSFCSRVLLKEGSFKFQRLLFLEGLPLNLPVCTENLIRIAVGSLKALDPNWPIRETDIGSSSADISTDRIKAKPAAVR
jgi:hypothetical protein